MFIGYALIFTPVSCPPLFSSNFYIAPTVWPYERANYGDDSSCWFRLFRGGTRNQNTSTIRDRKI